MNWYKRASNSFYVSYSDDYGNLEIRTRKGKEYTFTDISPEQQEQLKALIEQQRWAQGWQFLKQLEKEKSSYETAISAMPAI